MSFLAGTDIRNNKLKSKIPQEMTMKIPFYAACRKNVFCCNHDFCSVLQSLLQQKHFLTVKGDSISGFLHL